MKKSLVMSAVGFCSAALWALAASSATAANAASDDRQWKKTAFAESDNAGDALTPQMAFDANANGRAVWVQSDGTRRRIVSNGYSSTAGWNIAIPIDTGSGDSTAPQIAVDPGSDSLAVWIQPDGDHARIVGRPYLPASGWGLIQTLDVGTGDASGVQVAIDSQGHGLATWSQSDGARKRIWWASYIAGLGWTPQTPLDLNDPGLGDAQSPQIAFDASGNALAVWQQFDGTRNRIFARRYTGGNWIDVRSIDASGATAGDASAPQVAFDPAGNALAVWVQVDTDRGHERIFSNRWTAGNWAGAAAIDSAAPNQDTASAPQIAFDTAGNAAAVWSQSDGTSINIWANRFTPATNWGAPATIEDQDGNAGSPAIAFDANGNAVATWNQATSPRFSIRANVYDKAQGKWGAAQPIESDDAGSAFKPRVAFDVNGTAVAIWYQSDGTVLNIKSARYTREAQFTRPVRVAAPGNNTIVNPQLVVDTSGNALLWWSQTDSPNSNIWWSGFTPATGWTAPDVLVTGTPSFTPGVQIAFGKDGAALAVIVAIDGSGHSHVFSRRYSTGVWGSLVRIDSADPDNALDATVSFDMNGDAIALWRELHHPNGTTVYGLYSSRSATGSSWTPANPIQVGTTVTDRPLFKLNASGSGLAVWRQPIGSSGPGQIWMVHYAGGQFTSPAKIDISAAGINTNTTMPVDLAIGPNGDGVLMWSGYNGKFSTWVQNYTAATPGWSPPARLGPATTDVIAERVAFSPDGTALAAWQQSAAPGRYRAFVSRYAPSSSWGPPARITSDPNGYEFMYSVAFDAKGQALAAWEQVGATVNLNWVVRSGAAGAWNGQGPVETDTSHSGYGIQLAFDANGNALVIWVQRTGSVFDPLEIWANRAE